ncbi:hypothetical protein BGX28_006179 [Mortierella sp. GBA30]|nr:hypothetical protein BGX28_006179 [Mortierella sp. GBA30]
MKSLRSMRTLAIVFGSFFLFTLPSYTAAIDLDQCTLSLATLLSDPGLNTCLPMHNLAQLLTDPITPALVNDTATALCSYPICGPESIKLVQNTVSQNCVNASDKQAADLIYGGASLYPPLREGVCQRVSTPNNGTFCATVLTETLTAYMAKNPSPLGIKIFANATVLQQYVDGMPQDILCTSCNKAMINPLVNYIAQNENTLTAEVLKWANVIKTQVQAKCGAGFTNGVAPAPDPSTQGAKSAGTLNVPVPTALTALGAILFSGAALL